VKLSLKSGETIRIKTDGDVSLIVWIGKDGEMQATAQPKNNPTRLVVADKNVKMETA